jgi:hypothetical protein
MKAIALIALAAFLAAALAPGLGAGICEEAFVRCVYDPDLNQFFNFMGSLPIFCGLGYVFCKTYVDPIIV